MKCDMMIEAQLSRQSQAPNNMAIPDCRAGINNDADVVIIS